MTMEDWIPTIMAWVGEPGVKEKLLTGYKAGNSTYNVHLDGYDQTDLIAGKGSKPSARSFSILPKQNFTAFATGTGNSSSSNRTNGSTACSRA